MRPTTEQRTAQQPNSPPDEPEVKSGVHAVLRKSLNCDGSWARRPSKNRSFRFYALYDRIYRCDVLVGGLVHWLRRTTERRESMACRSTTFKRILGAAAFLNDLREELRTKTYRPQPVKRVYIRQAGRPDCDRWAFPTVRDRIVQTAVLLVLEPIFEADFLDSSFGFRPGKSAHQAIDAIRRASGCGLREVYDADLQGYFDTIPHDQLMKACRCGSPTARCCI